LHISQGSVVTILSRGGQNYKHLQQVSSGCCMSYLTKIGQCRSYWQNRKGTFFETQYYTLDQLISFVLNVVI